jgi:hypothetical protein
MSSFLSELNRRYNSLHLRDIDLAPSTNLARSVHRAAIENEEILNDLHIEVNTRRIRKLLDNLR